MDTFKKIKSLAENRIDFFQDSTHGFYKWSPTYFYELAKEIVEAEYENKGNNKVYLEYELCDIFWDYICLVSALKSEWKIDSIESVLEKTLRKFSERVWEDGRWKEKNWEEIKAKQKQDIAQEHLQYSKNNNF